MDALKDALYDVVERHESLRTRINYSETDGSLGFQEVLPPLPVPFTTHHIPIDPDRSRDEVAADLLVKLHDEVLPHSTTPSLRAALHRFDNRDAVLTLLTHHLYCDGLSAAILRSELVACYRARLSGTPHGLPAPVQYHEYGTWERKYLQSEKAATARRFWKDRLAGAEMYTMPADRAHGPDTLTPRSAARSFTISAADFAKVVGTAAQSRCTVWHLLMAAVMALAERIRGSSDITLLTVDNGRPGQEFHNSVGFFANLVPLRLEFGNCETYRDLMLLARKVSADAHQRQLPFETILEVVPDLMNAFGDSRAVPIAFAHASSPKPSAGVEIAAGVEPVVLPEGVPSMFHRGACVWNTMVLPSGEFRCVVEYEPNAVDATTVDCWGTEFARLVLAIADRPDGARTDDGN